MTGLFILLGLLVVVSVALTIAVGGNAHLAAENRQLRTQNAALRGHPAATSPVTLFTSSGGVA